MRDINLDDETFEVVSNVGFKNVRHVRDGLQVLVSEALTSPEPDITGRIDELRATAKAYHVEGYINWTADQ